MKIRCFFFLLLTLFCFAACKNEPKATLKTVENAKEIVEARPHPVLQMPASIDMGVFQEGEMVKTVEVMVRNTGNAPLMIAELLSECDCTTVTVADSLLNAGDSTMMKVSLDLTGYPSDTIRKSFTVISNSKPDRVMDIKVMGLVK